MALKELTPFLELGADEIGSIAVQKGQELRGVPTGPGVFAAYAERAGVGVIGPVFFGAAEDLADVVSSVRNLHFNAVLAEALEEEPGATVVVEFHPVAAGELRGVARRLERTARQEGAGLFLHHAPSS